MSASERLLLDGFVSRRIKKPLISKQNIKDKLTLSRNYMDWTAEDWSKNIFSDEKPPSNYFGHMKRLLSREEKKMKAR